MKWFSFVGLCLVAGLAGQSGCSSRSGTSSRATYTDTADTYHIAGARDTGDRYDQYRYREPRSAAATVDRDRTSVEDRARAGNVESQYMLAYPTGRRDTSVILLEADGPRQVRVGQPFTYNLRVTNLTDMPLEGVAVYDMGGDKEARAARMQSPAWDVGTIPPHQTLSHQVTGVADEVGILHTCMAVTYTPTLCTAIQVVKPEIQLTKEGPSEVLICQDIPYRYVVTNTGSGVATGVRIQDALPEGLTTADRGRTVTFDLGDLRPGESKEQRVILHATARGQFTSRAIATSGDARSQSRSITTIVREPVLSVYVDAPESRYVEEPVDYRITVRNTGDAPANRTILHLAFAGGGERMADREVGTIAPGQSKTIPVSVRAAGGGGEMRLNATAEAECARPSSDTAAVAIRTIPAMLLECVDSVDPVRVGGTTVYTITVTNQGSGPDSNVTIRALVPPEEQFVQGGGASAIHADGAKLTFDPIPTLPAKQSVQWKVEVKGVRPGDARFNVDLTTNSLTRPASKSESTRVIDASGEPAGR